MKNKHETVKQIMRDFFPCKDEDIDYFKYQNISVQNFDPPAYIVAILFLGLLGYQNYGESDKVKWHTYFRYKEQPFMIRDYKFGTWSIEGISKNSETVDLVNEIKEKIISASKVSNKMLYEAFKPKIDCEEVYLNNTFTKLDSIYEFYSEKINKAIKRLSKETQSKDFKEMIKEYNKKITYKGEVSNYSFALIVFYFSLLEFLMDAYFLFIRKDGQAFKDFKEKAWNERFKIVFPVQTSKQCKEHYENLKNIRDNFRNPLSHGLRNELNLLVPLPSIGLVPLSYDYLLNELYYGSNIILNIDVVQKTMGNFKQFLNFLKKTRPYCYYFLYIKYGFPIPFEKTRIDMEKKRMTSLKSYKEHLEFRQEYEDKVINREI